MAEPPLRSPSELSYCVAATEQQHNRGSNTILYYLRLNCNSKGVLNVYFSLFQGDFLIFGARSVSHSISVGTVIWQLTPENHFPSPLNFRPPTFLCQRPYTTPSRTGSLASPCFSHDSALFDGLVHDHFFCEWPPSESESNSLRCINWLLRNSCQNPSLVRKVFIWGNPKLPRRVVLILYGAAGPRPIQCPRGIFAQCILCKTSSEIRP